MNIISLHLEEYSNGNELFSHGINFRDCVFLRASIDGKRLDEDPSFEESSIYFDELKRSASGSGRYLIFTCICGIAEDGGWQGVDVAHYTDRVEWKFEVESSIRAYEFEKTQYVQEINSTFLAIQNSGLIVEPKMVVFPIGM